MKTTLICMFVYMKNAIKIGVVDQIGIQFFDSDMYKIEKHNKI